eukprot:432038_1
MGCSVGIRYSGYIFIAVCFCFVVVTIFIMTKFIKYSRSTELEKSYIICMIIFYVMICLSFIGSMLHGLNACSFDLPFVEWKLINQMYYILFAGFYFIQYHIMLFVLFQRVYFVFKNSTFKLSKCNVGTFITIHVLFVIDIALSIGSPYLGIFSGIYAMLLLSLIAFLTILFNKKLSQLFKTVGENEKNGTKNIYLLTVITKCTVLTCASIIFTIIAQILFGLIHAFFVSFIVVLDVFSNLMCVTLTFNFSDTYYYRYCNFCDMCCRGLCKQINHIDSIIDIPMMSKEINAKSINIQKTASKDEIDSQSPTNKIKTHA